MTLDLTQPEIDALLTLINYAVKSQGMYVAETAVVLVKKIHSAQSTTPNPNSETAFSESYE